MQADYSWPAELVAMTASWEYVDPVFESKHRFTGSSQIIESDGQHWACSYNYEYWSQDQAMAWRALLVKLKGGAKSVAVPVYGMRPFNLPNYSATVSGSGQTGLTLATSWGAANTTVLKAGMLFGVNGELKTLTEDAVTDAGGNVTLQFEPALRDAPPAGSVISYDPPLVTMQLVPGQNNSLKVTPGDLANGALTATTIALREKLL